MTMNAAQHRAAANEYLVEATQAATKGRRGMDHAVRLAAMADLHLRFAQDLDRAGELARLRADLATAEARIPKFTAHPARVAALLSTGEATLVEGNRHHDQHWGICVCKRHHGQGENHLGRLLMALRAELLAEAAWAREAVPDAG